MEQVIITNSNGQSRTIFPELASANNNLEVERLRAQIEEWKEYRSRVEVWKEQVLKIVEQLKSEAAQRHELMEQVRNYRALLQLRDEQLERYKRVLVKNPPDV